MKTFKQLTIGESIYSIKSGHRFLDEKDTYGNVYPATLEASPIKIQSLNESKAGNLLINWNGTNNPYDCRMDADINIDFINKTICEDKNGNLFFSDIASFEASKTKIVLNEIKKAENTIKVTKIRETNRIEMLRAKYFHLLNPIAGKMIDDAELAQII